MGGGGGGGGGGGKDRGGQGFPPPYPYPFSTKLFEKIMRTNAPIRAIQSTGQLHANFGVCTQ